MATVPSFLYGQLFQTPPIPNNDLTGRTIIITGANTGLGLDCSKHFARLGAAHLILACRSQEKGEQARKAILQEASSAGKKQPVVEVWAIDLCKYASVVSFAERCKTLARIDAVVANAGVHVEEYSRAEDNEMTITINVVSTFLLAVLLLPQLKATARKYGITPYLTIVGSAVHLFAPTAQLSQPNGAIFSTLNDQAKADMVGRYNLSKLLVMLCTRALAAKISPSVKTESTNAKPFVVVNCVNPGWCKTELFRSMDWGIGMKMGLKVMGRTSEEGSRTLVHAIDAGEASHGQYLSETRVKPPSPFVLSKEGQAIQVKVWDELLAKLEVISPGISRSF